MRYNDVIEVLTVTDVDAGDEPLTLDEVKQHLNLLFDSADSLDFTDDDAYLTSLISQCREVVEKYTGLTLATKTLKAIVRNDCGNIEIPAGPVQSISSVKDADGVALTNETQYKLQGSFFKAISWPCSCYLEIDYTAGYNGDMPIPSALKRAILEEIAFRYNNRGDQQQVYAAADVTYCRSAMELAAPHKRTSWVA